MAMPPRSLPKELSICPLTVETVQSYSRLTKTLLPINYPPKFFQDLIEPCSLANNFSICRVAIWTDSPSPQGTGDDAAKGQIIGGISGRIQPLPDRGESQFYISTLSVLAPWRGKGIAAALLKSIITSAVDLSGQTVLNIERLTSVYAHVWEINDTALDWYKAQGFEVGDVVRGYYRKLRPDGGRIVRRGVLGLVVEGLEGDGMGKAKNDEQGKLGE